MSQVTRSAEILNNVRKNIGGVGPYGNPSTQRTRHERSDARVSRKTQKLVNN